MARPPSRYPTELELQVLKILWRDGESSVMEIRDALANDVDRDLARTSVVTTLNIMTEKKLVHRREQGRAYLFLAAVQENDVSRGMLFDLVNRVFDGSTQALIMNLLESEQVDDEEHKELRSLITKHKRRKKSS